MELGVGGDRRGRVRGGQRRGGALQYDVEAVEGRPPFDRGTPMATLGSVVSDPVPAHPHAGELGPVIDGLAKPVQIVPMGATVSDLVNHAALAAYGALSRKR